MYTAHYLYKTSNSWPNYFDTQLELLCFVSLLLVGFTFQFVDNEDTPLHFLRNFSQYNLATKYIFSHTIINDGKYIFKKIQIEDILKTLTLLTKKLCLMKLAGRRQ